MTDGDPSEYTPHPYALIFPPMMDEERIKLEADIKQNGLREKIVINGKNQIVDGLNRYRACTVLGIPPDFETRNLSDKDALALINSRNLVRRHLTPSQCASIGDELAQLQQGQIRKGANLPLLTQVEVARAMNISVRSVKTARKVRKASPELAYAVKVGDISLHAAEQITKLPEPDRGNAISAVKNVKSIRRPASRHDIPHVHDSWDTLSYRVRKLCSLPSQLRAIPDHLGEHPLSPARANELKHILRPVLDFDFADLVAATLHAIAVLDTIIKDQAIEDKPTVLELDGAEYN